MLAEDMVNEDHIRDRLVEKGEHLFRAPQELELEPFTKHEAAEWLVNDLADHPHAFVLASVMDQQIKSERAWIIPVRFQERLGSFSMETLLRLSESDVRHHMSEPAALHRYVDKISRFFFNAIQRIAHKYNSDGGGALVDGRGSPADLGLNFRASDLLDRVARLH